MIEKILKNVISMKGVKASRVKEYKKFLAELGQGSEQQAKLRELQVILEVSNDYKKDNSLEDLGKDIELLDTPGILWPKFDDKEVGLRLAFIGSINDEILSITDLAYELIKFLQLNYCQSLADRYNINDDDDSVHILEQIAEKRACIKKGGELDIDKAAALLLDDYRSGKLGRISLERPSMVKDK